MAATLLGALYETFTADSVLPLSMPGSPWLDEPIEGTDFPYLVITGFQEAEDVLAFEGQKSAVSQWSAEVYAVGEAAAEGFALSVRALWDGPALAVDGRNLLRVTQVGYRVTLERTRSSADRRVTKAELAFRAEWQTT